MDTPADKGWGSPKSLDYGSMIRYEVWPGHTVGLRNADVGVIMHELIRQLRAAGWHGPDTIPDEWGYTKRLKRWAEGAGQDMSSAPLSSWSDHSWGTALDLDTTVNPMYANRPANMAAHTSMPVAACPGIAAGLGLEWGGSWTQPWDPQHWQVAVTPARLRALADGIRARPGAAPPMTPPPPPEDDVTYDDAAKAVRDVLHLPVAGLGIPPGQHDNGGLAVLLVGMAQGEINRDRAEAAQIQAMIAAVDPDKLAALIAAKITAALPHGTNADQAALVAAAATALREVFADAANAAQPGTGK